MSSITTAASTANAQQANATTAQNTQPIAYYSTEQYNNWQSYTQTSQSVKQKEERYLPDWLDA